MKKTLESISQTGQDRKQMKTPVPENPTRKPIPEQKNVDRSLPDEVNVRKPKPTIPEVQSREQQSLEQRKTTSQIPAQDEEVEGEIKEHNPKSNVW